MVCSEAGGEGVLEVVGTGWSRFGWGEENYGSGSGIIGRRGENRRGGGNDPRMTKSQE